MFLLTVLIFHIVQASGATKDDNSVKVLLENVTESSLKQWLYDRFALRCWCSDDAATQLQLSAIDKSLLESERNSLLDDISAMKSGSDDAVNSIMALMLKLEVTITAA
jgi:hypothetical protein